MPLVSDSGGGVFLRWRSVVPPCAKSCSQRQNQQPRPAAAARQVVKAPPASCALSGRVAVLKQAVAVGAKVDDFAVSMTLATLRVQLRRSEHEMTSVSGKIQN